jgi:DNA-binding transcriptional MerR regulator
MELASIGEFARRSRLSQKALRLYDRLGLLSPAWVDPDSGYRWYAPGQLERARLIALLRELGLPLAEIGPILRLDGAAGAERIGRYWGGRSSACSATCTPATCCRWGRSSWPGSVTRPSPPSTGSPEPRS